jgi:cell division protein FtsA
MDQRVVVGIDIGTSKICTLVAREEKQDQIRIIGVGVEPSLGVRRGVVVDLAAASQAVTRSIDKAERTSGLEISSALASLAGSQVSSMNSKGIANVVDRVIDQNDVMRAIEAARAIAVPHNREIIHVIQRGFNVDGQEGINMPIGMYGYRLEVETHIISAASATVENLRKCVGTSGVDVSQFVLNPLASAEVVLTETERQMGVIICDIGGGTTDVAIFFDGDVWYTAVIPFGGNNITSDIAQGLRLGFNQAEEIKLLHGHAVESEVSQEESFFIRPFAEEQQVQINRSELANIIEARVEEMLGFILQEVKRSGYDGLLPAGVVLTGGTSLLPGIRTLANRVLGVPVRIARPTNLIGMTDKLDSPAYSTSIGLLRWALHMNEFSPVGKKNETEPESTGPGFDWNTFKVWVKRLLP